MHEGGEIDARDNEGNTPLHLVCDEKIIGPNTSISNNVETVKVLLSKGVKIEAINKDGETPLHNMSVAVEKVQLLLEHGGNKEALNNHKQTPLMKAAFIGINLFRKFIFQKVQ